MASTMYLVAPCVALWGYGIQQVVYHFEQCCLLEYQALVKEALVLGGRATPQTEVQFVLGDEKLRGNAVLSRGPKAHLALGDRTWRGLTPRPLIHSYFNHSYSNSFVSKVAMHAARMMHSRHMHDGAVNTASSCAAMCAGPCLQQSTAPGLPHVHMLARWGGGEPASNDAKEPHNALLSWDPFRSRGLKLLPRGLHLVVVLSAAGLLAPLTYSSIRDFCAKEILCCNTFRGQSLIENAFRNKIHVVNLSHLSYIRSFGFLFRI